MFGTYTNTQSQPYDFKFFTTPRQQGEYFKPSLHMEAFFGRPEITDQLIEARGNLDLQHENGATSLTMS